MKMRQMLLCLFISFFFSFLCLPGSSNASLLPFLDRPGSLLTDFWPERFPDPFRVLEQIPFGIERDDSSLELSLARVDWKETPEGHVIKLDVPGLRNEDVKIEVVEESRVLRVSGERKKEEEKKGDHWHRVERSYGKFWRQFRLPDNVDLESVNAKLENGVLTLSFSKLSPNKIKGPRVVDIAVDQEKPEPAKLTNSETKQEL